MLFIPAGLAAGLSVTRWSAATRTLVVAVGSGVLMVPVLNLLSIALGPSAGVLLCPAFALTLLPLFPLLSGTAELVG